MMRSLQPSQGFSRRRFVGCGAASFAVLPTIAKAQGTSLRQGMPLTLPDAQQNAQPDASKIAADTDAAQHLTINVMINGKGPFQFVVDTGADRSVVAQDVAVSLGLLRGTHVNVEGIVRTVNAETVTIDNLTFGAVSRDHLILPVLPRALLGSDGYLGLDAIDGYRVTLDFQNRALVIGQTHHMVPNSWMGPQEVMVPLRGSMGHLRAANCRVDGINSTAFIDTGAEVSVANMRLFNELVAINPAYIRKETVSLTGVTGGLVEGRFATVQKVKLGGLIWDGCNLVVADLQIFDIWGLTNKPALLIGMNFLREFAHVSIDYGRRELRFDLASLRVALRT